MAILIPRKKEFWQRKPVAPELNPNVENSLLASYQATSPSEFSDILLGGNVTALGTNQAFDETGFGEAFFYGSFNKTETRGIVAPISSTSGSYTFQIIADWAGATRSEAEYYLDTQTGRMVIGHDLSDNLSIYDGAWNAFSYSPYGKGAQNLIIELDGANSEARLYINGESKGSVSYTPRNIGGTTKLLERYTPNTSANNCPNRIKFTSINIWEEALTDGIERSKIENAFQILKPRRKYWVLPTAAAPTGFQAAWAMAANNLIGAGFN